MIKWKEKKTSKARIKTRSKTILKAIRFNARNTKEPADLKAILALEAKKRINAKGKEAGLEAGKNDAALEAKKKKEPKQSALLM